MREYLYILNYIKVIIILLLFAGCSDSPNDIREKADKLYVTAQDYYTRGYLKNAEELFSEVIELEKELKLSDRQADCYLYLGLIAVENFDYDSAEKNYEISRALFRKKFDRKGAGMVENNLGNIFANLGNIQRALSYYKAALLTGQLSADKEGEAIAQMNMGSIYLENKEFRKAFDYFNKAYDNYQIIGNLDGELSATFKIGESFYRYGSMTDAMNAFKQGYDLAEEISQKGLAAEILNYMGMIYAKSENYDDALTLLNSAVLQAQNNVDPGMESTILANIGDIQTLRFDYPSAIKQYSEAIENSRNAGKGLEYLYLRLKLAKSIYNRGVLEENLKYIQSSKEIFNDLLDKFRDINDKTGKINILSGLMMCDYSSGKFDDADSYLSEILFDLKNASPQIKNSYSENMIIPPQIFSYNDIYKILLIRKNNAELISSSFKFSQIQITDFLNGLNSLELKEVFNKKLFDSLKTNCREIEYLSIELINELAKEGKYRNSDKINNIKNNLIQNNQIQNQVRDIQNRTYMLDKYDLTYLQKKLESGSALISFLLVDDSLNTFIIDKNSIILKKAPLIQTVLSGQIKMLTENLQKNDAEGTKQILSGLYQNIFKGLEKSLTKYKKIYFHILNDQSTELNYVPFHSLIDGNDRPVTEKYLSGYFGGFKNSSKFETDTRENVLIFDSIAVKQTTVKLTSLKCSNVNKQLILNKKIEALFILSDSFMSLAEPNNSHLKISTGNEPEYDISMGELNKYSINAAFLFNYFSDNSSSMRLLSYITPDIKSLSILPYNIPLNQKIDLLNSIFGLQQPKPKKGAKQVKFNFGEIALFNFVKL